jgi:hypothetical protein
MVSSPYFADEAAEALKDATEKVEDTSDQSPELPIPAFIPAERPLLLDGSHVPQPMPEANQSTPGSGCENCQGNVQQQSQAPPGACGPQPRIGAISPWFAGADLLFLSLANESSRRLVVSDATSAPYLSTSDVDGGSATGFDAHIGRYFGCGRYGLDVGYFFLNPGESSLRTIPASAGDYRASMPAWRDISVNPGVADTVWNYFDDAAAYRARRDMFFQGIEANWVSFGVMGARRMGICGPAGPLARMAPQLGHFGFFGGACGPLARACSGCVQFQTSQGFRWFQFEDAFEFAGNINGTPGYQSDDLYYNVETENNLFGYQLGSRVTYCLGPRLNIGLGGKIGLYGNHATYRQRIGTATNLAYISAGGVDDVLTSDSDTFVSALGELDLGLGFRLSNAWTVRGGYRLLSACGVATATGSIAEEYTSLASSGRVSADDCVILHGGYVGLDFNW